MSHTMCFQVAKCNPVTEFDNKVGKQSFLVLDYKSFTADYSERLYCLVY